MNPTPGDVHVNKPLTNISIAYAQDQSAFVADKVFPNVPVQMQSDRYYVIPRGYFNRDEMKKRAPSTEAARGHYTVDNTPTYFCDEWAWAHDIPDPRRANSDSPLDPDREAAEICASKALIRRESSWAAAYMATSVWTTDITGVAGVPGASQTKQWNDDASDPIKDVRTGVRTILASTGKKPNTLVLGFDVFNALQDHPEIVDRVKYGQMPGSPAIAETAELAAIFKIPRVFVMESIVNAGVEGQADSHSFIGGGKSALLCFSAPSPSLMTATAGYTFSWTGRFGASAMGWRIKRYRVEEVESDRVEVQMAFTHKVVAADLGYFWTTIVA